MNPKFLITLVGMLKLSGKSKIQKSLRRRKKPYAKDYVLIGNQEWCQHKKYSDENLVMWSLFLTVLSCLNDLNCDYVSKSERSFCKSMRLVKIKGLKEFDLVWRHLSKIKHSENEPRQYDSTGFVGRRWRCCCCRQEMGEQRFETSLLDPNVSRSMSCAKASWWKRCILISMPVTNNYNLLRLTMKAAHENEPRPRCA